MYLDITLMKKLKIGKGDTICVVPSKKEKYRVLGKISPIPIDELINFCINRGINTLNIKQLSLRRCNPINLPDKNNLDLHYLLGSILGDGCLSVKKGSRNGKSYTLKVSSQYLPNILKIRNILLSLFGLKATVYKEKTWYNVNCYSKILVIFLNKIYSIPIGKKYFSICIPKIVKEDKSFMIYFLKGLCDSDGNIYLHRGKKCVQLRQKSYSFLKDVKSIFHKLGIYMPGPYYDKANNSWVLWSSKKSVVDNFIKEIGKVNYNPGPVA